MNIIKKYFTAGTLVCLAIGMAAMASAQDRPVAKRDQDQISTIKRDMRGLRFDRNIAKRHHDSNQVTKDNDRIRADKIEIARLQSEIRSIRHRW